MTLKAIALAFVAALAACGGASAERPLPAGEARPSEALCRDAVHNYEHDEFILWPDPLRYWLAMQQVDYEFTHERRLRECTSRLTASEANCVARAPSLDSAENCAPAVIW